MLLNKLDRYVLRSFLTTVIFAIVALCVIFLVVDLIERLNDFLDRKAPVMTIAKYYLYFFPQIIKLLTPVAMLVSCLFTIGRLSNLNEITAMKSGGMSLYRLMIPLLIVSTLISFGQLYFNGWIVPQSYTKKYEIESKYLNALSGPDRNTVTNLYFRDTPLRNVVIGFYDVPSKSGSDISIEEYSAELHPRTTRRIDTRRIEWDSVANTWILVNGFERTTRDNDVSVRQITREPITLSLRHAGITSLQRSPDEMNFDELREYITLLSQGGKDVRMKLIEYYGNYAFPFANLIVIIFAVPFASVRKKGGIAVEIAAAMIASFSYLVFSKVSQSLGMEFDVHPIVVAWFSNGLFLLIGIVNVIRSKT